MSYSLSPLFRCALGFILLVGCNEATGGGGSGGTGGNGGAGGDGIPVECMATPEMCTDGTIDPIIACCELEAPPEQAKTCTGMESLENPTSCMETGNTVTYELTVLQLADSCDTGYDLDGCDGWYCFLGALAPGDGLHGVDNALAGLAPEFESAGGNLGTVNQAFSDGLCGSTDDCSRAIPPIEIGFQVDSNEAEGCANVKVIAGESSSDVILNLSAKTDSGTACASGRLGTIPLTIGDERGVLGDTVVRMTVSEEGFSHGLLGVILDEETAVAIAEANAGDADVGAIARQAFDITEGLRLESMSCNALSATLQIGGVAEPPQ